MKLRADGRRLVALGALTLCVALSGCRAQPPLALEQQVDLMRFMGDWFVIACIPTRIERNAYAPTESYRLDAQGRVRTTYSFHRGGFDGPLQRYTPTGFVQPGSGNAVWGMQFIWPIKADYRIMYVDPAYTLTVIGRQRRDYTWIMARTPHISEADMERLRTLLAAQGYDASTLRSMAQPPSP